MKRIALVLVFLIVLSVTLGVSAEENKFAVVSFMIHPYSGPTEVAMKDYAEDTGIECEFNAPAKADQNAQNRIIEGMVSRGFNGFALFPSNAAAGNGTITELVDMGIPVVAWGGPPNQPTDASMCIATDVGAAAAKATRLLIKEMGGEGNIVNLLGQLSDPNTIIRRDAIREVVDEHPDVHLLQEIANIDKYEAAAQKIDNLMAAKRGEVDGMISTAYVATVVASEALRDMNNERITFIGMDDDPTVLKTIKDGYVTGTMVQNPYAQGYLSLTALKYLKEGYKVKDDVWFIDSGVIYVTEDNVDTYSKQVKANADSMLETFKEKYFVKK